MAAPLQFQLWYDDGGALMVLKQRHIRTTAEWITNIRHRQHLPAYRDNYIKYYYVGLLNQYRQLLRDRVLRQPYKTIDYDGEFGTELKFVIPFAYWHHCNGTLLKTVSSIHSRPFYYFLQKHEEKYEVRTWKQYYGGIPNSEDHNIRYNLRQWKRVPFKKVYQNDIFVFDKPVLLVSNKYNIEWDGPPVNFLSLDLLRMLFSKCSRKFQIIYNRPGAEYIANDDSEILHFGDRDLLRNEFPEVIDMADLYQEWRGQAGVRSYNDFQLFIFANCERFISVHGGASVLASYFGGVNVIYSVKGFEHYFGEFESFYPQLSGAKIMHARTETQVLDLVTLEFLAG